MNRTTHKNEMSITTVDYDCVVAADSIVGESPVWCVSEQKLYWVDIVGGLLHRYDPAGHLNQTWHFGPDYVTSVSPCNDGQVLLTLRKDIAFFDLTTTRLTRVINPEEALKQNRFNDGKCDRKGRLWAGTMGAKAWDKPVGHLYCFTQGNNMKNEVSKVICSNGTGWSPDNKTMYYTESFRYAVFAYDYEFDTGTISNRRKFIEVMPDKGGFPDGLTVDSEGFVWSCQPGFGRIVRYDPDGVIDRIYDLPVSRGTSCMFAGDQLDQLYITSAQETLTPQQIKEEPWAGSLLKMNPGVKGIAEVPFNNKPN